MSGAARIARKSLHAELVDLIRELVVEGELTPGEKVPELALCERFGVSRTPLREALKVLAAEGIIELLPNRGAVVARISAEQIDELFPIMGALEALAGELACQRISDGEIKKIRKLHDRMLVHFERGERAPYARLNQDIHNAFFEIAGNAALSALYQSLMARIHSARFLARKTPEHWQRAIDDHVAMIDALEARDSARIGQLLKQHLEHKADMVRAALKTS